MARADEAATDSRVAAVSPPPPTAFPENHGLHNQADVSAGRDEPSLADDLGALVGDAKTYLQAELTFQKSRAGYTANQLKSGVVYGAAAFAFLHLALIALTVGLVVALSTLTGPWIATAIVVALLLAGALIFGLKLRSRISDISGVFEDAAP